MSDWWIDTAPYAGPMVDEHIVYPRSPLECMEGEDGVIVFRCEITRESFDEVEPGTFACIDAGTGYNGKASLLYALVLCKQRLQQLYEQTRYYLEFKT